MYRPKPNQSFKQRFQLPSKGERAKFDRICLLLLAGITLLLDHPVSAQPLVAVGNNFTGSTAGVDSNFYPPDANGGVGTNYFVELINGRFSVYNKAGGARVQTFTSTVFWSRAGVAIPPGWDPIDPRICYDPRSQRWFASAADSDSSNTINTNRFLLAVSATSDPTGTWKGVAFWAEPGSNNFADFPTLGLDSQGVYLSADMFNASNNSVESVLWSLPKAALLAATPSIAGATRFSPLSFASRGEVLQPAFSFDSSGPESVLAAGDLGYGGASNTNVIGSTITNASTAATLLSPSVLLVPSYTIPNNPTQPDGSANLDDGDGRLSGAVSRVQGVLFAVHSTQMGSRTALRWYRINSTNYSLLESGTISDPILDLFYPSISANAAGTVVIAFNGCSSNTFVSSYAVAGLTTNGITHFGNRLLLKAGLASYQDGDPTGISRWGDYSTTSVDPVDPNRFWTIQTLPASASTWMTQITEILTATARPYLSIQRAGTNVMLSWQQTAIPFELDKAPTLATPVWSPIIGTFITNSGLISIQLAPSNSPSFFRLKAFAQ